MSLRFTLMGTGTSQGVPVLGCQCNVCTSSDPRDQRLRTAALVQSSTTTVAIDVGPDFRQQMLRAKVARLDGILLTHEHNDHMIGLDDVRPFNFIQKGALNMYGLERVNRDVVLRFQYIFAAQKYPGAPSIDLHNIEAKDNMTIGDISIEALGVYHGKLEVLGYKFGKLVYLTDVNEIPTETLQQIGKPEILVLDALHENLHHSHFNLAQAVEVASVIDARQTYLVHMSHRMGLHAEVSAALPDRIDLAYDGLQVELS